ncbi:MAG: SDR family oxidoreductase [Thermoproteota archaeon]|nr:SDR family oxidoreductase [Thermoproteota archaeon]
MTVAIVTGSTKGIGKSISILLAKNGIKVVVCSRNQKHVEKTVNEINSITKNKKLAIGFKCDTSQPSDVENIVKWTIDTFGTIDILVNNAGVSVYKGLLDTTLDDWYNTININLTGCFLFCKHVLPHMIQNNRGTIINISSGAGKMGFPKLSAYCASKFGLMGFSESISKEVVSTNIRVMVLCPGEINTDMLKEIVNAGFHLSNKRENLYQPEDVANKIYEMIREPITYRNGQIEEIYSGTRQ